MLRIALPFLLLLAACGGEMQPPEDHDAGPEFTTEAPRRIGELGQACDAGTNAQACSADGGMNLGCQGTWQLLDDCSSHGDVCRFVQRRDGGAGSGDQCWAP